jgi:two-component system response regulator WspF
VDLIGEAADEDRDRQRRPPAREALRGAVASDARLRRRWMAATATRAIEKTRADRPDLILMDLIMPGSTGRGDPRIMAESPCPILVVTATVSGNMGRVYEAMGLGALTPWTPRPGTPRGTLAGRPAGEDRHTSRLIWPSPSRTPIAPPAVPLPVREDRPHSPHVPSGVDGGPNALGEILGRLPPLDALVVIVQHVDEAFSHGWPAGWAKTGRRWS